MARKGITYDMVANAATAIQARGTEPTISAIRIELNNEGSFSTISQHLAKWREQSAERVDLRQLPPEVENAALTAITTIWNIAQKEASTEIAGLKEEHRAERKRMQADIDALLAGNKELEVVIEREVAASERDRKLLADAEKKLTALSSELETHKRLYAELVQGFKRSENLSGLTLPDAPPARKAGDTKPARRGAPKPEPESKPGGPQEQH